MSGKNLTAFVQNFVQEKLNIQASSLVYFSFITAVIFFLIFPFKLLQFICLGICGVIILSFFYAIVLKSNIQIERNTASLKLACKEKSEITFTIKNYSPLTAHVCYYFDSVPYFYIFNDENKGG